MNEDDTAEKAELLEMMLALASGGDYVTLAVDDEGGDPFSRRAPQLA